MVKDAKLAADKAAAKVALTPSSPLPTTHYHTLTRRCYDAYASLL